MTDNWLIRKVGLAPKGPYPLAKVLSGIAKLPKLDAIEVSHPTETNGEWIAASSLIQLQNKQNALTEFSANNPPQETLVGELIRANELPAIIESRGSAVSIPTDVPTAIQHPTGGHSLERYMADGQDPKMVAKLHQRVTEICTRDEVIEYMAIQQRPVANLSPDAVVLTNRRIMIFRQKLLGRMDMADLQWMQCRDVRIKEDIMGATIFFQAANGSASSLDWLPKPQARKVYRIAQEMEEAMVEFRRNREMEVRKSGASNIVVNTSAGPSLATPSVDPMAKLMQLKQMFEAGLITDEEYSSKKQEILSQM